MTENKLKAYKNVTEIGDHNRLWPLYGAGFENLGRKQVEEVSAGDIIAIAGVEGIKIGDTVSSLEDPKPSGQSGSP